MNKVKISAVSYTNTKPFLGGLAQYGLEAKADISVDNPSECAQKLIDDVVDIGLIPVAAIPLVKNAVVVSDYCIGSDGAVNSVFIFSKVPVAAIGTLRLDVQSRTSNNLAKILLKYHWKQEVTIVEDTAVDTDAVVLIGDRTFTNRDVWAFSYDLGEIWKKFTGLPFVYAAWVANKPIDSGFIADFNEALKLGVACKEEVAAALPVIEGFDMHDYLVNKLDFKLDAAKRKAMQHFLDYIKLLEK